MLCFRELEELEAIKAAEEAALAEAEAVAQEVAMGFDFDPGGDSDSGGSGENKESDRKNGSDKVVYIYRKFLGITLSLSYYDIKTYSTSQFHSFLRTDQKRIAVDSLFKSFNRKIFRRKTNGK